MKNAYYENIINEYDRTTRTMLRYVYDHNAFTILSVQKVPTTKPRI